MIKLRDDQVDVKEKSRGAMKRHRHVCIQASCGWGKTIWACDVIRSATERKTRVLVVAHRRRLIQQWSASLDLLGVRHGVIMSDLPESLADKVDGSAPVQVASKDTLIARIGRASLPPADLVVIDEVHNALSPGFSQLLSNYQSQFWLGLTATPVTGDGRGLGGMFGELVCAPPLSHLAAAGIVVPFRVYAALEMASVRRSGDTVKPAGDPVAQWVRHANGAPTVVFAPRRSDSESVVKSFNASGISAVHVDAHSTEGERDNASDGLASGKIKVVSQVGLYVEGVDIPCVAVVQLLAKCGSLVKYIQASQRAGRAFPGKQFATLIDHTGAIFDHGFPDDDLEWSLLPGKVVKKSNQENSPPEPFVCAKCGLVYSSASACPGCGSVFSINRKMYQPDLFSHLVEVDRDYAAVQSSESDQRCWTRLLYQFGRTNKKLKAAIAAFRGKTGKWPNEAGVEPLYDFSDAGELVTDVFPRFGTRPQRSEPVQSGPSLFTEQEQ